VSCCGKKNDTHYAPLAQTPVVFQYLTTLQHLACVQSLARYQPAKSRYRKIPRGCRQPLLASVRRSRDTSPSCALHISAMSFQPCVTHVPTGIHATRTLLHPGISLLHPGISEVNRGQTTQPTLPPLPSRLNRDPPTTTTTLALWSDSGLAAAAS
jgi:hypothetical protein